MSFGEAAMAMREAGQLQGCFAGKYNFSFWHSLEEAFVNTNFAQLFESSRIITTSSLFLPNGIESSSQPSR